MSPFELRVREVFSPVDRVGPIVVGPFEGSLTSRDPVELVDADGSVTPVAMAYVEMHSRAGELGVVLVGVGLDQVRPGQMLRKAQRWPNYSSVRFITDRHAADGAPRGSTGTIVEVYGIGYEVEVCDQIGRTLFLGAVADGDIERSGCVLTMLSVEKAGSGYRVEVSPPHSAEPWRSTQPLTATGVLEALSRLGSLFTDITDALYAEDPSWTAAHDAEVLRARGEA